MHCILKCLGRGAVTLTHFLYHKQTLTSLDPALYSAGSDANTIYGDSYNFTLPGNTMGFAINSGRMAGESVAEYIRDCEE